MGHQRMWLLPVLDGRRLAGVIRYAAHPAEGRLGGIGTEDLSVHTALSAS